MMQVRRGGAGRQRVEGSGQGFSNDPRPSSSYHSSTAAATTTDGASEPTNSKPGVLPLEPCLHIGMQMLHPKFSSVPSPSPSPACCCCC